MLQKQAQIEFDAELFLRDIDDVGRRRLSPWRQFRRQAIDAAGRFLDTWAKTGSMPTDDRLRFDDHEGIHNVWCNPIEANKNQAIESAEGESFRRSSSQHIELVAQRYDLRLERSS
jgi:hypothetical protein